MCGEGAPIELVQRFEKEYGFFKKNNKKFCYVPVNDWEYIDNIFSKKHKMHPPSGERCRTSWSTLSSGI